MLELVLCGGNCGPVQPDCAADSAVLEDYALQNLSPLSHGETR